jgi:hypothetical protein
MQENEQKLTAKVTSLAYNAYISNWDNCHFQLLTTWDKQCEHNLLAACSQTCYKM